MNTEHIVKDYSKHTIGALAIVIENDWNKPYFGAIPYLEAMATINSINDRYFDDSAAEIVGYFLANSSTWRGEVARDVKKELNKRHKAYYKTRGI